MRGGLVRIGHPEALNLLADLLADPEPPVRIAAARALADQEDEHAIPLLRLRALAGDQEPGVVVECLAALIHIAPARSIPFVVRFLADREPLVAEGAALALGASRRPEALPLLRKWLSEDPRRRGVAFLAIATLRHEEAFAFLLSAVREESGPDARAAVEALGLYRGDEDLRRRVEDASARPDLDLRADVARAFAS